MNSVIARFDVSGLGKCFRYLPILPFFIYLPVETIVAGIINTYLKLISNKYQTFTALSYFRESALDGVAYVVTYFVVVQVGICLLPFLMST